MQAQQHKEKTTNKSSVVRDINKLLHFDKRNLSISLYISTWKVLFGKNCHGYTSEEEICMYDKYLIVANILFMQSSVFCKVDV